MRMFPAATLPVLALRAHWLQALKTEKVIQDFSNRIGVSAHRRIGARVGCFPQCGTGHTKAKTFHH
jgi:hypothetical protein